VSETAHAVAALEAALGHRFADPGLAETALSHPSHAHELDGTRGNERLEFLGDAVLDLVIARELFVRRPDWPEGSLTRARAALVNKASLAARARGLGLRELVRLGKTEHRTGGTDKDSILADCFEAVIGAVYLDAGLAAVEPVIERCFGEALAAGELERDAKTSFQEWAHSQHGRTPTYRTVSDTEVDNDEQRFTVEVFIDTECWGRGVGRTKRAAETAAARSGLARGRDEDEDES